MAVEVFLPKFNMDMEEGTILRWIKHEGDIVRQDEPICEVETNKVNMEVEAPASGILCDLWVPEGETIPVTTVLAYVAADETEAAEIRKQLPVPSAAAAVAAAPAPPVMAPEPLGHTEPQPNGVRATPAVRRAAREAGIDLATLAPVDGRVTMEDVQRAMTSVAPAPTGQSLSPARRVIATRMVQAHSAPHVTLDLEVGFGALMQLRQTWPSDRPSLTAMLAAAACRALGAHPLLNSTFEHDLLTTTPRVNLALAVTRPQGLVAPVVTDAQLLGLDELSRRIRELVDRARIDELRLEETQGGTFTLTNLGQSAVDRFSALMNPPQVAILAVGRVTNRPVAVGDHVEVQPTGWLTVTCDHRVVDGEPAAAFLGTLRGLIEDPSWLTIAGEASTASQSVGQLHKVAAADKL